jgi:hypothetical protein
MGPSGFERLPEIGEILARRPFMRDGDSANTIRALSMPRKVRRSVLFLGPFVLDGNGLGPESLSPGLYELWRVCLQPGAIDGSSL